MPQGVGATSFFYAFFYGIQLTDFKQMGFPNPQRPAASINTDEVKDEKDSLSAGQASPSKNHLKLQVHGSMT